MKKNSEINNNTIVIQNNRSYVKRAFYSALKFTIIETIVIFTMFCLMFSYINKTENGLYVGNSIYVLVCITTAVILMVLNTTSAFPLCEYWIIDENSVKITKLNTMKSQIPYTLNKILNANFKIKNDTFEIDKISSIKLHAVKNMGRGVIYGSIGYKFIVSIFKKDGTEYNCNSAIDFKKTDFIKGIEFLKEKNIPIEDKNDLLKVISESGDINNYLNFSR